MGENPIDGAFSLPLRGVASSVGRQPATSTLYPWLFNFCKSLNSHSEITSLYLSAFICFLSPHESRYECLLPREDVPPTATPVVCRCESRLV